MKAITIRQPWATLIAVGAKQYETRSWRTTYLGPLAIHSSKTFNIHDRKWASFLSRPLAREGIGHISELPLGAIVAVCTLAVCIRTSETLRKKLDNSEKLYGNFADGRYAWRLTNVRLLAKPIATRGYQSLWTPNPDLIGRVKTSISLRAGSK